VRLSLIPPLSVERGAVFHPIFTRWPHMIRKTLISWRSLRDSNPCYSLERAVRREREAVNVNRSSNASPNFGIKVGLAAKKILQLPGPREE